MDNILEELSQSVLSDSNSSDFSFLVEDSTLKSRIKNIVEDVFKKSEDGNLNFDSFFISMADTPTVSGSFLGSRNLKTVNDQDLKTAGRDNIVNSIAELENTINIKENQLVENIIKDGIDKKIVKKLSRDLNFEKRLDSGLTAAFGKQNSEDITAQTKRSDSVLVDELHRNQNSLNYLLKDGVLLKELNQLSNSNNYDLLDVSVLTEFLNLPTLVQECSKKELYQEALFLQQIYLDSLHKFKGFMIRSREKNNNQAGSGIVILDLIKEFITNVVKDDMVNKLHLTLTTTSDFITLKRVVDVVVKVNQDNLKSLEMFIDTRFQYLKDYLIHAGDTNIMEVLDFFREELFNILNIYQLIFASNDTNRNLPVECFVLDFLLPCKINYQIIDQNLENNVSLSETDSQANNVSLSEAALQPNNLPKYTNILILKLLNDSFNELLKKDFFSSKSSNCVLQLIYCAYRLKDSNINYFHLMLNKLVESEFFSEEEIVESIKKRRELSMLLHT